MILSRYDIHMSQTLENLAKAFAGESQARNRYTIYSSVARKEGYLQISDIFLATAEQEKEHAEWFFKMIQLVKEKEGITDKNEIDIPTTVISKFGDTLINLETSIAGEHHEEADLYPLFAQVAQDEGHPEVAARIRAIIKAEIHHEERYTKLYEQLKAGSLYKKPQKAHRVCSKC
jgi:rubrerythrin